MTEFKIMVCGSRTITDRELVFKWIEKDISIHPDDKIIIIEGEAKGVDSIAKDYALINHLDIMSFPADWNKYGKAAGIIRNEEMVKACDHCLIIWDGQSKGTKNDIDLCRKYHKTYRIIVPGKVNCNYCDEKITFVDKTNEDNFCNECHMNTYTSCKCENYSCFSYALEENIVKL